MDLFITIANAVLQVASAALGFQLSLKPAAPESHRRYQIAFVVLALFGVGITVLQSYRSASEQQALRDSHAAEQRVLQQRIEELSRLAAETKAGVGQIQTQTEKPVRVEIEPIEVKYPPATPAVNSTPPPPPPAPALHAVRTQIQGEGAKKQLLIAIAGTQVDVQADMTFLMFRMPKGGSEQTLPLDVTTPWLFTKDRGVGLSFDLSVLQETELAMVRSGDVVLGWRVTAEYEVNKEQRERLLVEVRLARDLESVTISANQRVPVKR